MSDRRAGRLAEGHGSACGRTARRGTLACIAALAFCGGWGEPLAAEAATDASLPRVAPHEPAAALGTFTVAPGYRIEQVAAEPLVHSPVAVDHDERGRMFVVEMIDYSEQENEHLGTVRMLEDLDDDGRYDTSTVFAKGLSWPTGVLCYDGGAFVCAAPDLLYLKDTDGDGSADERRVVFTGFGRSNVQGRSLGRATLVIDTGSIHGGRSFGCDPARMPFDFPELIAALAPRGLFVNAPLHDDNFDCDGVKEAVAAARPAYAARQAEGRLVVHHPDCGHDFPPAQREAAYGFLAALLEVDPKPWPPLPRRCETERSATRRAATPSRHAPSSPRTPISSGLGRRTLGLHARR